MKRGGKARRFCCARRATCSDTLPWRGRVHEHRRCEPGCMVVAWLTITRGTPMHRRTLLVVLLAACASDTPTPGTTAPDTSFERAAATATGYLSPSLNSRR